jgi:hypothetical protein
VFSKFFGQKKPYKEVETPAETMRFLGEPTGDGLGLLKGELAKILTAEGNTVKAYLRKVQYAGEDRIRIALVIDGRGKSEVMAAVIARECQPLIAIDLVFFESLNSLLVQDVQSGARPFYVAAGA